MTFAHDIWPSVDPIVWRVTGWICVGLLAYSLLWIVAVLMTKPKEDNNSALPPNRRKYGPDYDGPDDRAMPKNPTIGQEMIGNSNFENVDSEISDADVGMVVKGNRNFSIEGARIRNVHTALTDRDLRSEKTDDDSAH